jgi:hypothetical protein
MIRFESYLRAWNRRISSQQPTDGTAARIDLVTLIKSRTEGHLV